MRAFFRIVFLIALFGFIGWVLIPNFVLGRDIVEIWPWLLGGLIALSVPLNIWAILLLRKRR